MRWALRVGVSRHLLLLQGPAVIRGGCQRQLPPCGSLRGPHPERCPTRRSSRRSGKPLRAGYQHQDCREAVDLPSARPSAAVGSRPDQHGRRWDAQRREFRLTTAQRLAVCAVCTATAGRRSMTTWAACTKSVRRYLLLRLEIRRRLLAGPLAEGAWHRGPRHPCCKRGGVAGAPPCQDRSPGKRELVLIAPDFFPFKRWLVAPYLVPPLPRGGLPRSSRDGCGLQSGPPFRSQTTYDECHRQPVMTLARRLSVRR